jgi:probable F420-dependent oxidoreductase
MIVGVNMPNYSALGHRDAIREIAQTADALGYASLWTTDHVLLPSRLPEPYGNLLESLTTLAYIAATTEHIRLATSVLVLPQRNPILVAKQAATLQHLSGGRLTLGVGVGWVEEEYQYLHADFHRRGQLADEYISAIRNLLTAEHPQFHGPTINYAHVLFSPKPTQRLPIVVGGSSRAALNRAVTLGDGWHGIRHTPEQVEEITNSFRTSGAPDHFEVSLRTQIRLNGSLPDAKTGTALTGDPDSVISGAKAYARAGVDHLVLEPETDTLSDFLDQLTAFAREVLPALGATPQI